MDEYQNEIQYYNVNGFGNISNYFHNGAVIIETINFKTAYIFKKWLNELNDELLDIVCNSDLHNKPKINIRRKELARRNRSVRRKERLFENNMRNNEYHRKLVDNGVVSKDLYIKTYINEHKSRRTIKHTLNTDFFKYILDNFKGVKIDKERIYITRKKGIDEKCFYLKMNEMFDNYKTDNHDLICRSLCSYYGFILADKYFVINNYYSKSKKEIFKIIKAYEEASKTLKDRRKEKIERLQLNMN
jgi:hypothetical protein